MTALPFWSLIPTFIALAGTITLFFFARRHKWAEPVIAEPEPAVEKIAESESIERDLKSRVAFFISQHRWEVLLAGVTLALIIYLFLFAPVQITGKVSIKPMEPGRPFFFLHWQRNVLNIFYYEAATISNLLTGLLALALVIAAMIKRSRSQLQTALLWSLLSLASAAQWCLGRGTEVGLGIILYLISALGFFVWARMTNRQIDINLNQPAKINRNLEIVLVVAMIALASFGRLFELQTIPYGIEGDEAKWTGEVVWLGVRGLVDFSGLYHRDALPTSFYMQTPFHKLFGPSIFIARFEVAFFSIIATLLFYLFLRRITNIPLALLSAWLLSASIFDISASRLANVESHVKLWPILTLLLLAWAINSRRWPAYVISGIALALGLLTYDTVWPLLLVATIICIIEISRQNVNLAEKIRFLTALLAPSVFALPILIPYFVSRLSYYEFSDKGWEAGLSTLWPYFVNVLESWYIFTNPDFLYNRAGPLVNAILLPWITMGFFAALATIRQRFSYWTLIWLVLFIFPVPIAAHTPLGRVYYAGLPAVYALAALGLFLFSRDSLRTLGKTLQPVFFTFALTMLIWLPLLNFYIYFNEIDDAEDRQIRREIAEITSAVAGPETLIVLPSAPHGNEPLNNEYQMIELFMLAKVPTEEIKDSYKNVALDDLMPALPYGLTDRPNLEIILDKIITSDREKRDALAKALQRCYPEGDLTEGYFFDRFSMPASVLAKPACLSASLNIEITPNQRVNWSLSQSTVTSLSLQCGVQSVDHILLEAETLPPPPGWQAETAFAIDWSGSGFMLDNYSSVPIDYEFEASASEKIYVWTRTLKRVADNSPLQLKINEQVETVSDAEGEELNKWIWERVGPFDVPAGQNILTISRTYVDDPFGFMAIFLDTFIITPDENFLPEQDQYLPLPPQRFNFSSEQNQGQFMLNLEPGIYQCYASVDGKQKLVDNYGNDPIKSNVILIEIKP